MDFACIAHKLVSSRRPTKYASAASCRVRMVCTWKCMSYLPTSRAISWTKCEKGSLHIRRFVLFWKQWISCRATVPGQYLWGFLTFPALRNSFWRILPPMVGQSFLLTGSSPPDIDGPASAAIWAKCQVGRPPWWPPHLSQLCCLLHSPLQLTLSGASSTSGAGGSHASACTSTLVHTWRAFYLSPFLVSSSFLPCWNLKERVSQSEARAISWVTWHPFWIFN